MNVLSKLFGQSKASLGAFVSRLDPLTRYFILYQLNERKPVEKWATPPMPAGPELSRLIGASTAHLTLLRHFDSAVYRKQLAESGEGGSRLSRLSSGIDMQLDWFEHGRGAGLVFAASPERKAGGRNRPPSFAESVASQFDEAWYANQLEKEEISTPAGGLLNHYLQAGCLIGLSPNSWFDERFYLSRNSDVLDAVLGAKFRCGFEHFMNEGQHEQRRPSLDEKAAFDEIYPGLDRPILLEGFEEYERLVRPRLRTRQMPGLPRVRVNYLVPRLGNDVMFGGLISFMHFIRALDTQFRVVHRFIITEDQASTLEILGRVQPSNPCYDLIRASEIIKTSDVIAVSPNDLFVAYNAKAAYMASRLAAFTTTPKFIYFAQEWESIFHSFGAVSSAIDESYSLDCHLLFNSQPLREWFGRLGLGDGNPQSVFTHVLTRSEAPPVEKKNYLIAYLRPEGHAARNCCQTVILALRHLLETCPQARGFTFLGVGSLQPSSVWLNAETELRILPKMPLKDYAALLSESKVGVSLMNAPHPSVVPFEMAQFGMYAVTNTYVNRPADYIRAQSRYLVPCRLDYKSVAAALAQAISAALDEPGQYCELANPPTWDQAFAPAFAELRDAFALPG